MKKNTLVIFFINFLFVSYGQNDPCVIEPKKFIKKIYQYKLENNPQKRIAGLSKLLSKNPEQPKIYFEIAEYYRLMGMASLRSGNSPTEGEQLLKKSIYFFQKCIQKCKNYDYRSYFQLGNILLTLGNEKDALLCFKEVLNYSPYQNGPSFNRDTLEVRKIIKDLEFEQTLINNPVPFAPEIVRSVSSEKDEYFPMISPDNDLLFYTRKVDRTKLGDIAQNVVEEFTVSTKSNGYSFSYGFPLKQPFNDGVFDNYGSATLSVDNREMIICACKKERIYNQNYLNCDLYSSTFIRTGEGGNDFQWSPLKNLGSQINTKDGWEAQPSLSSDGKMLFFTSFRKGSRDNDIYIAHRQDDGNWGKAEPFDEINTAGKDKSPFFHQDGETLYFVSTSSPVRKGLGGLDIFYIRKTETGWTKPKNIGYPINTPQDELGLFVSTSGRIAYFSTLKDGNWNIYSFPLYEEARPEEVVILKGTVKNKDGSIAKDAKININYDKAPEENTAVSVNEDDGTYAAVIKVNKTDQVSLTVDKKESAFAITKIDTKKLRLDDSLKTKINTNKNNKSQSDLSSNIAIEETIASSSEKGQNISEHKKGMEETKNGNDNIKIPKIKSNNNRDRPLTLEDIRVENIKKGAHYELDEILYETDSYTLKDESKFTLRCFADYLKKNKTYTIKIEGHTDDIGDRQKNLILSQNRAKTVKEYLIEQGIKAERIDSKGYGESRPRVPNNSPGNRKKNRRTEFELTAQ